MYYMVIKIDICTGYLKINSNALSKKNPLGFLLLDFPLRWRTSKIFLKTCTFYSRTPCTLLFYGKITKRNFRSSCIVWHNQKTKKIHSKHNQIKNYIKNSQHSNPTKNLPRIMILSNTPPQQLVIHTRNFQREITLNLCESRAAF
jgi:hypothetical protein